MREFAENKGDVQLRREAFEAYARACACAMSGGELRAEGRQYAEKALALLSVINAPDGEDEALRKSIELIF